MILTEQQIKKGFWYFDPAQQFPPECISHLDEYKGGDTLNIACTQLSVGAAEQRSIVKQWCKSLSSLANVKFLWFSSRVSQEMFEAVSDMPSLEGLYIKWSGIKSIASISAIPNLKFFYLGNSGALKNIDILSDMRKLVVLELVHMPKISDLAPLTTLTQLEGLGVEGGMEKTQIVDSLAPLSNLVGLRYLFLANLKSKDNTLKPLSSLHSLMNLRTAWWWQDAEFQMLRMALPNLKYGNPVELEDH